MLTHFIGNLTKVCSGQIIVIVGKTTDAALRLDLNLRSGKKKDADIALNLAVRFYEKVIIRNSRQNGEWGTEEREQNLHSKTNANLNPIQNGEIFKFYIQIGDQQFHIAVNNQHFCTFKYRLPLDSIRTIQLKHDLQFVTQVDHRSVFPFPHPPVQFDDSRNVFSNDVPRRFRFGDVIVITAIPYGNPKGWFLIKFTEAASKRQALHMSARFEPHFVVVRNSMDENGGFGVEERFGGFPFILDQQFRMAIAFTSKDLRIAIDGSFFSTFNHRSQTKIEKINGFKMSTSYGMYMDVTSVDHLGMDSDDCDGFEHYSHPDVDIE